jgi:hypothetical protein
LNIASERGRFLRVFGIAKLQNVTRTVLARPQFYTLQLHIEPRA